MATPETKPKGKIVTDSELVAMQEVWDILLDLEQRQRERVAAWIQLKIGDPHKQPVNLPEDS